MVRRGGKEVVTVDVYKEIYESLKKAAEAKKYTTKAYVNLVLDGSINKLEYLNKIAPNLSIDSYEGNRITLKDSKSRRLIDVFQYLGEFHCDLDQNRTDCIHVKFVLASPEGGRIHVDTEALARLKSLVTKSQSQKSHLSP